MNVPKLSLIAHLDRIHCNGEVGEVVLSDRFAATAVTADRQLMVYTTGLSEVEPLPAEVGVVDLPLFLNSVKALGEEDGRVSVDFTDHRVVVEERNRAKIQMVTASPETIGTRVDATNGQLLLDKVKEGQRIVLAESVVRDLLKLAQLLKADTWTAQVNPGYIIWTVGQQSSHFAEVTMIAPGDRKFTEHPYELVFNSRALVSVLKQVTDFTQTAFVITGPASLVAVTDPLYTYLLSPVRK